MKIIGAFVFAAATTLLQVPSAAASGCEATLELDTDQVRHHLETLKSADADELDQLDVLGALMCADRPGVRDQIPEPSDLGDAVRHHAGHRMRGVGQHSFRNGIQSGYVHHRIHHRDVSAVNVGRRVSAGDC